MQIVVRAGRISGTAWVPQGSAVHELVVMLPGFATSHSAYTAYAEHLASHGFVVVGVDTRSNLLMSSHDTEAVEVVRTLDWLLEDSPFKQRIDATKVAVAGHSKGGKLAFFAAALDARIDVVIGWDPVNGGGGPCAFDPNCNAMPVAPNCAVMAQGIEQYMRAESLVIGAPPDPDLNPEASQNCVHFYRGAPSPAALIVLATSHAAWSAGANEPDVFRITKAATLARLLQRFRNVAGLDDYLPESAKLAADVRIEQQSRK
jgi:dienelactone hydrolase